MNCEYDANYRIELEDDMRHYEFPALYKKDSKGKIRIYKIEIEGDAASAVANTTTGVYGVGKYKANEKAFGTNKMYDDAYKRAEDAMHTVWRKKIRSGYTEDKDKALTAESPRIAMLPKDVPCEQIAELPRDLFPLYVQPKLNGVRGTYHHKDKKIYTRNMKDYDKLTKMIAQLDLLCESMSLSYLDFEIYKHGLMINEIVSAVRHGDETLKAFIFDVPHDNNNQAVRMKVLSEVSQCLTERLRDFSLLTTVPARIAKQPREIQAMLNEVVNAGGEGIICRKKHDSYKWDNKNSRDMRCFKIKPILSDEFTIIGVGMEERKHEGKNWKLVRFTCVTKEGKPFDVSPTSWGMEKRETIWSIFAKLDADGKEKYVESLAPVTLEFREWTTNGKPFHILEVISRDYE